MEQTVYVVKFAHCYLPMSQQLQEWGQQSHNRCKLRGNMETDDYIFQCPQRHKRRRTFIDKLKKHLEEQQTKLNIRTLIIFNYQSGNKQKTDWSWSLSQVTLGGGISFVDSSLSNSQRSISNLSLSEATNQGILWDFVVSPSCRVSVE